MAGRGQCHQGVVDTADEVGQGCDAQPGAGGLPQRRHVVAAQDKAAPRRHRFQPLLVRHLAQAVVVAEKFPLGRRALRVIGRSVHAVAQRAQCPRHQPRRAGARQAQRQVGLAARQVDLARLAHHFQVDAGPVLAPRRQPRYQEMGRHGWRHGQPHRPLQRRHAQRHASEGQRLVFQPAGLGRQGFPFRRQGPASRQAVEQAHGQRVFQRFHPARHRGVLHTQLAGGGRQAAQPRQFQEVAHVVPLQGVRRGCLFLHRHCVFFENCW